MTTNNDDGIRFIDETETVSVTVEGVTYTANYIIEEGNIRLTTSTLPDGQRHSTYAPLSKVASPASDHSETAEQMLRNLIGATIQKASNAPAA